MSWFGIEQPRAAEVTIPAKDDPQANAPKVRDVPRITGRHDNPPMKTVPGL